MSWRDKGEPAESFDTYVRWDGSVYFYKRRWNGRNYPNYRFHRKIRTTNERRNWDAEHGRVKRSPCRLPDAWDDIVRHIDRCWKSYRLKQCKERH